MRKITCLAFVIISVALGGCGSRTPRIHVDCEDFYAQATRNGTIELTSGEQFELVLCANPTTGFQWEDLAAINDPAILEQTGVIFEEPSGSGGAGSVGAPGVQRWTFRALDAGSTQAVFSYSQPWEGGEKKAWTFTLSVTVR